MQDTDLDNTQGDSNAFSSEPPINTIETEPTLQEQLEEIRSLLRHKTEEQKRLAVLEYINERYVPKAEAGKAERKAPSGECPYCNKWVKWRRLIGYSHFCSGKAL